MSNPARSTADAIARLRQVGFSLVQQEPRKRGVSDVRPDLLAWASDENGDLVPWAAVEIKSGVSTTPALTLPALSRCRDLLGTRDHYAVVNGEWFKADRSVRALEAVDGPQAPRYGTGGVLHDEDLVTSLLMTRLWREADRARSSGIHVDYAFPTAEILYETGSPGVQLAEGQFLPVEDDVFRRASRRAVVARLLGEKSSGMYVSTPGIAQAVAALAGKRLGGRVLDPFCGTGSFLWVVMDRAAQQETPVECIGYELNPAVAQAAEAIGRGERFPATIIVANAYNADLPQAQVVVSAPPVGLRLQEPHQLLDGSTTTDGETAAVDLCLRTLQPGGRAVLHLSTGFTFKRNLQRYRQHLADTFRVAALIGLPSGALPGTGIRSVLLVVDRAEPGPTFVAQLGEDWEVQLGAGGPALEAAVTHLRGGSTTEDQR